MKKIAIGSIALSLLLCFVSCARQSPTDPPLSEDDAHLETIASLEAELQKCREELYITQSQYKAEVLALQQQLAALGNNGASSTTKGEQSPVFRYHVEQGGVIITGYSGGGGLLNIPATLEGLPVIGIGERAFEDSEIVGVVLPDGVRSVGWFAFYGCTKLTHITLPASIDSIGYAVFDGCTDLTVFCKSGSYAEAYAKSYGLSCLCN